MMPAIIISSSFNEQGRLIFRATPLQKEFASPEEAVDNHANGFRIQISTPNFPRRTRSDLSTLQQTCFHQPFNRMMADATYPRGFAQTDSLKDQASARFWPAMERLRLAVATRVRFQRFPLPVEQAKCSTQRRSGRM